MIFGTSAKLVSSHLNTNMAIYKNSDLEIFYY